ncbi:radical SAM protein [Dysgonomonas sp. 216]|uniref:radical SAM protein n=1 Tax=Dysgonomonas sp. 216 TaxID=2302934 RepID=UPI0013D514EA|nr:radical SAM protein [Dysgonomonas sp. 216]NDW17612.1 radical SAM protein [Dysgonomonas sp. 216]
MDIYRYMKKFNQIDNVRLKLLALWAMHVTGRRYIGVFFDPVLACNLRCKMCYFSDEKKRKELKGIMTAQQVKHVSEAFFSRAVKVQIGCGAEPTLYKAVPDIIKEAKKQKVPYVSITTNANLLTEELVKSYLEAGLDEFTISMHGVTKDIYEYFMTNADYDTFCRVLNLISEAKRKYNFKLRINYTINEKNLEDLNNLFNVFGDINIDILQLRPIENIGDAEYNNYDRSALVDRYDDVIDKVKQEAISRNITCLAPSMQQVMSPKQTKGSSIISALAYCYVSPEFYWKSDFNKESDTFATYSKRTGLAKQIFKMIFKSTEKLDEYSKHLNYEIN